MKKKRYPTSSSSTVAPEALTAANKELKRRATALVNTVFPPLALKPGTLEEANYNKRRHNLALCVAGAMSVGLVVTQPNKSAHAGASDFIAEDDIENGYYWVVKKIGDVSMDTTDNATPSLWRREIVRVNFNQELSDDFGVVFPLSHVGPLPLSDYRFLKKVEENL